VSRPGLWERLPGSACGPGAPARHGDAGMACARPGAPRRDRPAEQILGQGEPDRDRGEMRIAAAALRLAQDDPHAATATLAPVLDGSAPVGWRSWLVAAFLREAIARPGGTRGWGRPPERARTLGLLALPARR
jgi:hypothetical protein